MKAVVLTALLTLLSACGMSPEEIAKAHGVCQEAGLATEILHNASNGISRVNCVVHREEVKDE